MFPLDPPLSCHYYSLLCVPFNACISCTHCRCCVHVEVVLIVALYFLYLQQDEEERKKQEEAAAAAAAAAEEEDEEDEEDWEDEVRVVCVYMST